MAGGSLSLQGYQCVSETTSLVANKGGLWEGREEESIRAPCHRPVPGRPVDILQSAQQSGGTSRHSVFKCYVFRQPRPLKTQVASITRSIDTVQLSGDGEPAANHHPRARLLSHLPYSTRFSKHHCCHHRDGSRVNETGAT